MQVAEGGSEEEPRQGSRGLLGRALDILYFPLLGLRGSYLLIFFKSFKPPPSLGVQGSRVWCV